MRRILFFVFLLASASVFACKCSYPPFMESYLKSDFVARVKIVKNHAPEGVYYASEIQVLELFKGNLLSEIYVWGVGTSCEMYIPENTEVVIFANKNDDNKFTISACSEMINLSEKLVNDFGADEADFQKYVKRVEYSNTTKLKVLRFLASKKINFTSKINYYDSDLFEKLAQFNGMKFKKRFAIFEITFTSDVKVKFIKKITGFTNKIDKKLLQILKNQKWTSRYDGINDKIPENSKTLIGLYYIEEHIEQSDFISYFL